METDGELMSRCRCGDEAAFALLIERHRANAERYAASLLKDSDAAKDIVQLSFAKVYALRRQYQDRFSFTTYLYTLIRNSAIDELRRRKRRALPPPLPDIQAETPEEAYLRTESAACLLAAMEALPDIDR